MITIAELHKLHSQWIREHSYTSRANWVMSSETNKYIKLNLVCQCNRPGLLEDMHASGCIASVPGLMTKLFGWDVKIDDDMSSGSVAIVNTDG